jgi:biotin transport system substrate-specific component
MRPSHLQPERLMNPTSTPQDARRDLLRAALLVLAGTIFIALSARIQVPMWPVPMTMQTFAVLLVGITFGARLAGITLLTYIAQGALGLPVFASGVGMAALMGPTAGYILGFGVAAVATGYLADRGGATGYLRSFATALLGGAIIYALGAVWLAQFIGVERAITLGVVPFVPGDVVKCALVALVLPSAWKFIRGWR